MAQATQPSKVSRVTAEEVKRRIDRGEPLVIIDSRNPQAWSQSNEKLPGAIRVPANQVAQHLNEIPKNKAIVTYCT